MGIRKFIRERREFKQEYRRCVQKIEKECAIHYKMRDERRQKRHKRECLTNIYMVGRKKDKTYIFGFSGDYLGQSNGRTIPNTAYLVCDSSTGEIISEDYFKTHPDFLREGWGGTMAQLSFFALGGTLWPSLKN